MNKISRERVNGTFNTKEFSEYDVGLNHILQNLEQGVFVDVV